jgi:Nif-specific regulatory protein
MDQRAMEEQQPWASCFLTDILITHLEETAGGDTGIDYPSLFRGVEGLEVPSDPQGFLRDFHNWIPLGALRELHSQCERITGRKDFAYHAARAYFDPGKRELLSPFEIIFRVLNDVRSVLVCSSLWAGVQTNYLRLQSFETGDPRPEVYMLSQFATKAKPGLGSIQFLRGFAEGFPRLYPFIQDVQCIEEISQVRLEDILREFPDFRMVSHGHHVSIRHRAGQEPTIEAVKVPLQTEEIPLSRDSWVDLPGDEVVAPVEGRITVVTGSEEADPQKRPQAVWAYKILRPGVLAVNDLSHRLETGQVFNAPYSRFRVLWKERDVPQAAIPVEQVRQEVSRLLFGQLKQIKRTRMRMIQYNIEKRSLALENIRLRREVEREYGFSGMIGHSPKIQELFGVVRALAETDVAVVIRGETGTGKELFARAIHHHSPRRAKRFVAVNCGALAETLLESELFGHEKGSFTGAMNRRRGVFEVADGGTLFLDEIGEISSSTQIRLLRVLQEGEFQRVGGTETIRVNVRILSATNQDLEDLIKKGRFRQDLYYRLNVFPIQVPPLRERADDIPLLVSHFIEKCNQKMRKAITGVSPEAMALLTSYHWPGNIRELENVIQRMMVVAKGDSLDLEHLPLEIRGEHASPLQKARDLKDITRGSAEVVERQAILEALSRCGGNVTKAAKSLGISRATLQKRMKLYNLRDPKE